MANFPTLTEDGVAVLPSYPVPEGYDDSVITSPFEGGYVQTRALCSRIKKFWQINYNYLSATNKDSLVTFFGTTNGAADSFTWTNPLDSVSYTVRFKPKSFSCNHTLFSRWEVKFVLEQV
jgi:phage-related protein